MNYLQVVQLFRRTSNWSIFDRRQQGYISGLNIGDEKARNTLKNISSADQIFLWMDNYCKANPLKDVSYGAETLMEELRKK
jgi:hypothetical protein